MTMLIHEVVTFSSSFSSQFKMTMGVTLGSLYRLGLCLLHSAELNGGEGRKKKKFGKKLKKKVFIV